MFERSRRPTVHLPLLLAGTPVAVNIVLGDRYSLVTLLVLAGLWSCWSLVCATLRVVRPHPVDPSAFLILVVPLVPAAAQLSAVTLQHSGVLPGPPVLPTSAAVLVAAVIISSPRQVTPTAYTAVAPLMLVTGLVPKASLALAVISGAAAVVVTIAIVVSPSLERVFRRRSTQVLWWVLVGIISGPMLAHLERHLYLGRWMPVWLVGLVAVVSLVAAARPRWALAGLVASVVMVVVLTDVRNGPRVAVLLAVQGGLWGEVFGVTRWSRRGLGIDPDPRPPIWPTTIPLVASSVLLLVGAGLQWASVAAALAAVVTVAVRTIAPLRQVAGRIGGAVRPSWSSTLALPDLAALDPWLAVRFRGSPGETRAEGRGDGAMARPVAWLLERRPPSGGGRQWTWRTAALVWVVVAALVTRTQQFAVDLFSEQGMEVATVLGFRMNGGRVAWDAGNFLAIAERGYASEDLLAASFPGYPLLIREVVGRAGMHPQYAAQLITLCAGFAAAMLFWGWMSHQAFPTATRRLAFLVFVLFPYGFVLYGVAYADALLLCFVLAAFLFADRERFVLAGLAAAAATYTRPNGLAVLPALIVLVLDRAGVVTVADLSLERFRSFIHLLGERRAAGFVRRRLARLRRVHAGVLLAFLGIGTYMVQMWNVHGDPLFFWSIQTDHYGHRGFLSFDTWLKVEFINRPDEFVWNRLDAVNQVVATLITATVLVLVPRLARRLGLGYATLAIALVVTLWVTSMWFAPAGRYLLPTLPFVIAVGAGFLVDRPRLRRPLLASCGLGLLILAAMFARVDTLNW